MLAPRRNSGHNKLGDVNFANGSMSTSARIREIGEIRVSHLCVTAYARVQSLVARDVRRCCARSFTNLHPIGYHAHRAIHRGVTPQVDPHDPLQVRRVEVPREIEVVACRGTAQDASLVTVASPRAA